MSNECLNCFDCKINTLGFNPDFKPEEFQYFMLQDDVWAEAAKENTKEILCIACVEKRLGRKLQSKDFKTTPREMLQRFIEISLRG